MKRQVLDDLVSQETEASISAALSAEDDPTQLSVHLNHRLADRLERAQHAALDTEKLLSTATARKLTEHFSLDRIQQILSAARTLLAQNSDSDSSEEDDDRQPVGNGQEQQPQNAMPIDQQVRTKSTKKTTCHRYAVWQRLL